MLDANHMVIVNEDGEEVEVEVLLTFEAEGSDKRYVLIVDPENEEELTKAIEELMRDKTIIMIAHRLKTVRHADQILVVADGKITQKGTHEQLMAEEGIYKIFVSERKEAVSWKIA